jgi:class 3 adenylate cyclase/predicted ATPase
VDIAAWLHGLGLQQYEQAFRNNAIDAAVLPELTADDLKDLGVNLVGHRRRLLTAIAALRGDDGPAPPAPAGQAAPASAAERRQLTVMFCDLVGSTELSTRFDPEDLREVMAAYHRAVAGVVAGFDGFVSRYMGDGVLVYFGYPQAHENDAERAVRAGLGAIDAVRRLDVKGVKLQTRVGIATGLVVVGDLIGAGSAQEQSVVGETPNLAARLQALAQPNTLVIAQSTRQQIGALLEVEDLGLQALAGFAEPQRAWRVIGEGVVLSRFEALRSEATPLIGRDEELELLRRCWEHAKCGGGRVVLLSGEPGIGKSRLTVALSQAIQSDLHIRLRYFCSPHHQDSALYPLIAQLERAAGFVRDDTAEQKLSKLRGLLAPGAPSEDDIALLAELLSLQVSNASVDLSPQRKREMLFKGQLHQFEALARRRPILIIIEDAQWMDPTSRELLDLTVERVHRLQVLLIVTCRPEFQPPWTGQPQVTMLALNRLDRRDQTALVVQIAGGKALPDEVITQIADRTDGVPLFAEELTKSVLESGLLHAEADRYVLDGALPPFAIPTSLHDSLMARLDRLASVRRVAQIGATIGREFSYTLLRAVSRLPEDELQTALTRLIASELVFQRGRPPDAVYVFKHALVQDAAHGSLLRATRQQLHAQIAEALEALSPELMETQPELLAQHYAEAGLVEKSVASWGKAAHRSANRSAMAEAAAQLQKGLDQLALLPDNPERQRQELEFCSALAAVLMPAKGHAAPEAGPAFARARELWEQLGSPSEFFRIPYGQSLYHAIRGELDLGLRLNEDLLRLSRQRNDSGGLVLGYCSSGRILMYAGRFASSRSHLEEVIALYEPVSHRSLVHQAGTHPRVGAQGCLGIVLFCLGFPDQALAQNSAAIAEARRLAHRPSLAVGLTLGTILLSLVGKNAALDEWADQLIAVASEQGFPLWRAWGTIYRGWVKVKNGDVAEGISLLRSGSTAYRATGAEAWMTHNTALLAGACEIAGQVEEAVTLLDDALQLVERTGERWLEPELHRHKGQLLLRQGHAEAAEELYRKALSIAAEQGAKLWELRAAMSLARLRRDQGRHTEAHNLLAPVYGWFTEGFDTEDLKEAKALLEELDV